MYNILAWNTKTEENNGITPSSFRHNSVFRSLIFSSVEVWSIFSTIKVFSAANAAEGSLFLHKMLNVKNKLKVDVY